MKQFLIILVVVAAARAQAPQPCCAPEQYMAGNGGVMGLSDPSSGPMAISSFLYGAFDFKNRMFGVNMFIDYMNGTTNNFKIIQKYTQDTQWVILEKYSVCLKQEAQKPEPMRCIPDNATFVASYTIGGKDGLLTDSWGIQYHEATVNGFVTASVTHDTCYPVGAVMLGDYNDGSRTVGFMSTSGTLNVTLGIPDPDQWFRLPSYCQQQNAVDPEPPFSLDILRLIPMFI